jgi:alpha-D-ribose 1-methylphosphonate 5-triphosphate synthase subunit PhnG
MATADGRETMNTTTRQAWMGVLARATRGELEALVARAGVMPGYSVLKPAETGTIMVEARAGGTGRRFNLGEATLSRCVVRLADGTIGFAYALGTDRVKATLSAVIDAMLQQGANPVLAEGVAELRRRQDDARTLALRKAAATKVDFFTMVRGHD